MLLVVFLFFNATAPTEIYTLSLHDALPISGASADSSAERSGRPCSDLSGRAASDTTRRLRAVSTQASSAEEALDRHARDRKSTRLNSSHVEISYAVFCLKKKKKQKTNIKTS